MGTQLGIGVACAAVVLVSWLLSLVGRRHAAKSGVAAASFALPGLLTLAAGAVLLAAHDPVAAIPLLSVGALCLAAAAVFAPSRHTRFRDFEHQFWSYVAHRDHGRVHGRS